LKFGGPFYGFTSLRETTIMWGEAWLRHRDCRSRREV